MEYWEIAKSYWKNKSAAQSEMDSFNEFVKDKIPLILDENKEVFPKIKEIRMELQELKIGKPRINEADGSTRNDFYPMEARIRNRTYAGPIYLTMKLYRREIEQDEKTIYIGDLPIMLKSDYCHLHGKTPEELVALGEDPMDLGGYFIINGSEKALMTQEILADDRVMIEESKGVVDAQVISTKGAFKGRATISRRPDGILYVNFPSAPKKLKLFILLKALGLENLKEIKNAFGEGQEIENDILYNMEELDVETQEDALDKIGKYVAPGQAISYRLKRAKEVIDSFLLPHMGQNEASRTLKAYYLGMMSTKAIERYYGLRGDDDKDNYKVKRLEISGNLMEHLFRYSFKYFLKDIKFQSDRTVTRRRKLNISTIVRPGAITERIKFAMSTGNWMGRATGVSKFMDRVNYMAPLSDLRKVKSQLNKSRELYEARDVHGTHWGRLCPIETPDGPQCGLVKNLALMARITKPYKDEDKIEKILINYGLKKE